MNVEIDKNTWNSFVTSAPGGSFLQSWEWGQLQAELRVPYWRMWETDGEAITGLALVIKRQLPWGRSWLYVPKGPLWLSSTGHIPRAKLLAQVLAVARQEGALFVRSEPVADLGQAWRKAASDVQPRHTLVVDLTKPEEALLSEMHQKTRYNIHVAEKRGVSVRFSSDPEDLTHFFRLSREVSGRTAFSFHPDEYYRAMLTALAAGPGHPQLIAKAELAIAEHEGDILAAHILVSFGDTVTYVHGASGTAKRNLMAPHLLQWESIKRAKTAGYARYDFFGVAPLNANDQHPWSGITKFKVGFGGQRVSSVGAYDHALDPVWYWAYGTSRWMRHWWRTQ